MIIRLIPFILISIVLSSQIPARAGDGFRIIANEANQETELTKKEVSDLFLKKTLKWNTNLRVLPVDLKETSPARHQFSKIVHDKSVAAVKAYWQRQIFTGKGVPPEEKSSDVEVLIYIQNNRGAIGYVSDKTSLQSFKGIKEIQLDK